MTNYSNGHYAEEVATKYLKDKGFEVVDTNWRTRVCEVDIIAKKDSIIYFVEVKYRKTASQGGGLEYITQTKLNQMQFAAQCWASDKSYNGDYELSAVEVSGDFKVTRFEPNLS